MKVCIVGTGNQSTGMAGLLAQEADMEELVLVDIDLAKAQKAAQLLFNGIYACYNDPLTRASLAAGTHYMDMHSNVAEGLGIPYRETIDARLDMDEAFDAASLTAVPCMGLTPGWANMMANAMIEEMDRVDSVIFRDVDWIDSTQLLAPIAPPQRLLPLAGPALPHPHDPRQAGKNWPFGKRGAL